MDNPVQLGDDGKIQGISSGFRAELLTGSAAVRMLALLGQQRTGGSTGVSRKARNRNPGRERIEEVPAMGGTAFGRDRPKGAGDREAAEPTG
ncbi:MAG: hypothetical protein ACR2H3_04005 [Acidimicrobiales bacterium]